MILLIAVKMITQFFKCILLKVKLFCSVFEMAAVTKMNCSPSKDLLRYLTQPEQEGFYV